MKISDTLINLTQNIRQHSNKNTKKIHISKRPKLFPKKVSPSFNQVLIEASPAVLSNLRSFFKLESRHAIRKNRVLRKYALHFSSEPRRLRLLMKLGNQLKSKERLSKYMDCSVVKTNLFYRWKKGMIKERQYKAFLLKRKKFKEFQRQRVSGLKLALDKSATKMPTKLQKRPQYSLVKKSSNKIVNTRSIHRIHSPNKDIQLPTKQSGNKYPYKKGNGVSPKVGINEFSIRKRKPEQKWHQLKRKPRK